MRRALLLTTSLSLLSGCWLFQPTQTAESNRNNQRPAWQQTPEEARAGLENARAQALAGDDAAVVLYAQYLYAFELESEYKSEVGELDWATMHAEIDAMLEQRAASPDAATARKMVSLRADLWTVTGRRQEALALWVDASDAAKSCPMVLDSLKFSVTNKIPFDDPADYCARNRVVCEEHGALIWFMEACYDANPSPSMATSLPWASEADIEKYERNQAQAKARSDAYWSDYDAKRAAEEQQAAASSSSSSSSSGSAASSGGSPELKNNCSRTVKLFFGDKPKFGSGRYSSIGANTVQNSGLRAGDTLWIVDDGQNGVAAVTASAGMKRIEITSSCTGFTSQ